MIFLLSSSTLYTAISKCIVSWFFFFYFDLPRFTQNISAKDIFPGNFRCCGKEAVIFFLSLSTLYIAFWKCVIFWFYIFYFNCQYSAKILLEKSFFLEILVAPRKKQWYSFFRGASCISHFQDLYSPDSTFSILIYDDLPTVVLQKLFFLEILSVPQEKQWYCIFCGTSYIYQFPIVKFPNSSFFYFVLSFIYLFLSFFNQNVSERFIYSGNFYAQPKEQWYWFFYGAPCI